MPYTEVQERNGKKYYYRVLSVRRGKVVAKRRVYLGASLARKELSKKEASADRELDVLSGLLSTKELNFLDGVKRRLSHEPKSTSNNRYEYFVSLFTYDSNAIEGNTLTLEETAQLLFEGIVPPKSLREVNEALNHKKAFDALLAYRGDMSKKLVCKLHELVVKDTLRKELEPQTGKYRSVQVYIRGVDWFPPKPKNVPREMKNLLSWYSKNRKKLHPVVLASYFHAAFEMAHPFVDGNGRVGRLLMNFILRKNGYPMVNVPNRIKRRYYAALQSAQTEGNLRPFVELILDIYRAGKVVL
ncbi:MAG: Fic family protein [Candidatus Aenigmatarchaeota archaeon]|nr:MAG: Fic family protein [Candidatus Aenigmarchaeota archaeon]